jgi:hypothetical protein
LDLSHVVGRQRRRWPLPPPLLRGGRTVWENLPRALGDPPAVLTTCGKNRLVRVPLDLLADLHTKLVELFDHPPGPGGGWRIDPLHADLLAVERERPPGRLAHLEVVAEQVLALAGREAVTGTVLEKLAQRRMGLRGRDSQFSAEYGVARNRLERKRKPQQHHQVLGAQHLLGIGREAGQRRASFANRE